MLSKRFLGMLLALGPYAAVRAQHSPQAEPKLEAIEAFERQKHSDSVQVLSTPILRPMEGAPSLQDPRAASPAHLSPAERSPSDRRRGETKSKRL